MSSNPNLPAGFFITTINGKRCTAVPRALTTIAEVSTTRALVRPTSTPTRPTTSSTPIEPSTQIPESPADVVPSSTAVVVAPVPVITSSQIPTSNEPLETQTPQDTQALQDTQRPQDTQISQDTQIPQETQIPETTQAPQDTQIPTASQILEPSPSPAALAVAELTTSSPTPEVETPTESSTPSTSISSAPSDLGIVPNPVNNQNAPLSATETTSSSVSPGPTANSVVPAQASFLDTTSRSRVAPAPIVGGVMGSVAFVGFVALIFWFFKRRRRYQRNSLLTPLHGERGSFNDGDHESISDEKPMSRFGTKVGYQTDRLKDFSSGIAAGVVGFGASMRSKVTRNQRDTPSVDLNRGNSQFFDGPIPQHSRNNSVMSNVHSQHTTVKDRFNDWWERCVEIVGFNWTLQRNKRLSDPFTMAGGLSEKQSGSNGAPDFAQFPHMNHRDLELQANGQQGTTLTSNGHGTSALDFGNLGPNFGSNNPFSDPLPPVASTAQKQPINKDNPFIDPVAQTQPPSKNKNTYVADVRRSRGQSAKPMKNNQAESRSSSASRPYSRYQSGVTLDRDSSSYRDTFVSFMSANGRRGKGRSDPFDLERPELWLSSKAYNKSEDNTATSNRPDTRDTRGSSILYPDPLRMSSVHGKQAGQSAHIRAVSNDLSIYSSGVSSLGGWAGPGPDLGPGSSSTSMRGNTSSDAGSHYRNDSMGGAYGAGDGASIKGSLSEMDLALAAHQRDLHNVSPLSIERDWTVVQETGRTSPVSAVSRYSRRGVGEAL